MYVFTMIFLFLKISVEFPKQPSPKGKYKSLLNSIEGGWYVKKLVQKLPPLKKRKLSKKSKKEEDEIKIKLHEDNQAWNDWRFQIHWNTLEWVNPRSRDEKYHFVCLLKTI